MSAQDWAVAIATGITVGLLLFALVAVSAYGLYRALAFLVGFALDILAHRRHVARLASQSEAL